MERKIKYCDFFSYESFASLINWFLMQDYSYNPENDEKIDDPTAFVKDRIKKDFSIISYEIEGGEDKYQTIFFFKDFLTPQILDVIPSHTYEEYFEYQIQKKFKYTPEQRNLFVNDEINTLELLSNNILTEPYFLDEYKISLLTQVQLTINKLYNDKSFHIEKDLSNKIKINLSRSELTCLFTLLRQAGYIEHKYDNDLGRLIENSFLCYNAEKKDYSELTTINKLLSGFTNGDKPIKTAAETLEEIFTNPEFYNLKP